MSEEYYTETGEVICQICKKSFSILTPTHMKKIHDIPNMNEYKLKFPGAPVAGKTFKARQQNVSKGDIFSGESEIDDIQDEISDNELEKLLKNNSKKLVPETTKEPEIKIEENYYGVHPDKLNIINFLKKYFSDVVNNYNFKYITLTGHITYEVITDISIPSKMIDFEFPNTFWHNQGFNDRHFRRERLEENGWKIITFNSSAPHIDEIEVIIRALDLI